MTTFTESEPSTTASPWRSVTANAGFVSAAGFLVLNVLAGVVIPPLVIFGIAFVAVGIGLRRTPSARLPWANVVISVLALAGSLPFIMEDLAHPETAGGFVPQLVTTLSVLVTLVAAVATIRSAGGPPRRIVLGVGAVGAVLVAVSLVATLSLDDDARLDGDVVVRAADTEFTDAITIEAGGAGIYIENADVFRHTFVIDEVDVAQELPGSTNRRIDVDLEAGEYRYYCDVVGHEGMEGVLTVTG